MADFRDIGNDLYTRHAASYHIIVRYSSQSSEVNIYLYRLVGK